MCQTLKKSTLLFVSLLYLFCASVHAQNPDKKLFLTKVSKPEKIKEVDSQSHFKVKTIDGEKIKGKFFSFANDYFVSTNNDTIRINEIRWIKAKKHLGKWEKTAAIIATFSGIYFSIGTVPAAFIITAMEGNAWIILAPVATLTAATIGFRALAGRKYHLKNWKLETKFVSAE